MRPPYMAPLNHNAREGTVSEVRVLIADDQKVVRDGLAALSPRQRNLLRQRYLHGLGCDRLATMYAVPTQV